MPSKAERDSGNKNVVKDEAVNLDDHATMPSWLPLACALTAFLCPRIAMAVWMFGAGPLTYPLCYAFIYGGALVAVIGCLVSLFTIGSLKPLGIGVGILTIALNVVALASAIKRFDL